MGFTQIRTWNEDDDGDRDLLFPAELLFVQSFLQTFKREWTGIDRLRMDKFFQVKSSVLALRGGSLFLFETNAFVSLTAGSLHVQTNLPHAEEDQLGQQVTAERPHTEPSPASLLSVVLLLCSVLFPGSWSCSRLSSCRAAARPPVVCSSTSWTST